MRMIALLLASATVVWNGCREVQPLIARDGLDSAARRRVVFLVDISKSMGFTDPFDLAQENPSARQRAAAAVVERFSRAGDAAFAFLLLDETARLNVDRAEGFISDRATIDASLASFSQARGTVDFESAMERARLMIEAEVTASSAEQSAGTSYELVLVSDGWPRLVVCDDSCGAVHCEGGACLPCDASGGCFTDATITSEQPICDLPRDRWCELQVLPGICERTARKYRYLEPCAPYNSDEGLVALASEIASLVGPLRVRLSTVLLKQPRLEQPRREDPEIEQEQVRFEALAKAGRGRFWVGEAAALDLVGLLEV